MLGLRTTYAFPGEYLQIYKSSFEPILHLLQSYVRMGFAKNSNGRWALPQRLSPFNSLIGEILDAQAEHKYHLGMPWRERDYYTTLFD